jgi:glycosyltransferase involved in cell wall biosynthesis
MKALYIGHYREGTGWGQAAIDYILALDSAGVDVVCRPIKLNDNNPEIPERVAELEAKPLGGSTHCIQHVLPHLMDYNGRFEKNIGLFVTETSTIKYTGWPQRLKQMDEIWVPCVDNFLSAMDGCPGANIKVIPHATDVSRFEEDWKPLEIPYAEDRHVFYFIGENIRRKRISALLQAYYKAFTANDNVMLVIKTSKAGFSARDVQEMMQETDKQVRDQLRMYPNHAYYPPVIFLTERLSEEDLMGLHTRGNTFCTTSFGEAWCIPAFDAMGFGNHVISSKTGGMEDFLQGYSRGYLAAGQYSPVFGADLVFQDMNTGHETWFYVDISNFAAYMRMIYLIENEKAEDETEHINQYSYESVGQKMKDALLA